MSDHFTSIQQAFLAVTPKITSGFSILGSAWILVEVWICSNKRYFVYHKLVSAMALYSIVGSVGYFASTWMTTRQAACMAQGFLIQMGQLGTVVYFAMLGLYYMMVITFSFSEDKLMKDRWELIFHVLPALLSIGTASASIPLGLYSTGSFGEEVNGEDITSPTWCWIDTYMDTTSSASDAAEAALEDTAMKQSTYEKLIGLGLVGLGQFEDYDDDDQAMMQSDDDDSWTRRQIIGFQWGFYLGPAWLCFIIMMGTLFTVFREVQGQEQRMKRYITKKTQTTTVGATSSVAESTTGTAGDDNADGSSGIPSGSSRESLEVGNGSTGLRNSRRRSSVSDIVINNTKRLSQSIQIKVSDIRESLSYLPRTRQVISQAMCYVMALFLSNLAVTLVVAYPEASVSDPFGVLTFQVLIQPIQGFFIFLAYRRPTYLRFRKQGMTGFHACIETLRFDFGASKPLRRQSLDRTRVPRRRPSLLESFKKKKNKKKQQQQEEAANNVMLRRNSAPGHLLKKKSSRGSVFGWLQQRPHQSEPKRLSCVQDLISDDEEGDDDDDEGEVQTSLETSIHEKPPLRHSGKDSSSTLTTFRSSITASKGGSSRQFEMTREPSMRLDDLVMEDSSSDDDNGGGSSKNNKSFNRSSGSNKMSPSTNNHRKLHKSKDKLSVVELDTPRPTRPSVGDGRRTQRRQDFRAMKQESQRFFDLVCMDIIPEAEGDAEEQWRELTGDESDNDFEGYDDDSDDANDLEVAGHKSFPVMSSRGLLAMEEPTRRKAPQKQSSNTKRLFAMINANPLFKQSVRFSAETSPAASNTTTKTIRTKKKAPKAQTQTENKYENETTEPKRVRVSRNALPAGRTRAAPPPRAAPHRTTSDGGYYEKKGSQKQRAKPDNRFWAKLELERKRKEMLKAISETKLSSRGNIYQKSSGSISEDGGGAENHDNESENRNNNNGGVAEEDSVSKVAAKRELEKKRKELLNSITANVKRCSPLGDNNNREVSLSSSNSAEETDTTSQSSASSPRNNSSNNNNNSNTRGGTASASDGSNGGNGFWARLELDKKRQEMLKSIAKYRISNREISRELDHIPEVSEHGDDHDDMNRSSQSQLTTAGRDLPERRNSSNEMSMISCDSRTTVHRSNTSAAKRLSAGVGRVASSDHGTDDDISLVSDTPFSDDENFSSSDDDDDDDNDEKKLSSEEQGKLLRDKIEHTKQQQTELRASLEELKKLSSKSLQNSARSFGEVSMESFHDGFLDLPPLSDDA